MTPMTQAPTVCAGCGHHNRAGARVCSRCGCPLETTCLHCRQVNRPHARFCRCCGVALAAAPGALPPAALPPAQPSLLNGRYRVQRPLAQGGMGAVYAVSDAQQPGAVWALKEMDIAQVDPVEQQAAVADFRREATLLAALDHANLVKVVDHFAAGGKEYLVMECVQGETVESFLRLRPRTAAQVLPIALQLCDVLDYLHGRMPPIIYRDLKPSNAMIEHATGLVKLIDFGIARFYKPGKQKDTKMMGTPGFAPPEQYGNGQTDARSDIFALGVTLHVMLTEYDVEQSPWSYPPARTLNPEVSPALERVIVRATAMRVADRYQSAAELHAALLACQ